MPESKSAFNVRLRSSTSLGSSTSQPEIETNFSNDEILNTVKEQINVPTDEKDKYLSIENFNSLSSWKDLETDVNHNLKPKPGKVFDEFPSASNEVLEAENSTQSNLVDQDECFRRSKRQRFQKRNPKDFLEEQLGESTKNLRKRSGRKVEKSTKRFSNKGLPKRAPKGFKSLLIKSCLGVKKIFVRNLVPEPSPEVEERTKLDPIIEEDENMFS